MFQQTFSFSPYCLSVAFLSNKSQAGVILMSARFPPPFSQNADTLARRDKWDKAFWRRAFFVPTVIYSYRHLQRFCLRFWSTVIWPLRWNITLPLRKSDAISGQTLSLLFPLFCSVTCNKVWPASTNNVFLLGFIVGCFIHCVPCQGIWDILQICFLCKWIFLTDIRPRLSW